MKTKKLPYTRQLRQLRSLSKRINRLLKSGKFYDLSEKQQQKLVKKFKGLLDNLSRFFSTNMLRKITAGAAFILGIGIVSPNVQAQSFSEPVINAFGLSTPDTLYGIAFSAAVDLDADGDIDILTTQEGYDEQVLVYHENTGTPALPIFNESDILINPFGLQSPGDDTTMDFVDIDNDGDQDLFIGSYGSVPVYFLENTGTTESPAFSEAIPIAIEAANDFTVPIFADLDNDGDFDLLVTEYFGNFVYYENIGTPEAVDFGEPQSNPFGVNVPVAGTYAALHQLVDIDKDGDLDLLFTTVGYADGEYTNSVVFQENIGTVESPAFGKPLVNPFGLSVNNEVEIPMMADMDSDGDEDLWMSSGEYGNFIYYENISNSLPVGSDTTITIDQDASYNFAIEDFPYSDGDGEPLAAIQIVLLPEAGALTLNGVPVEVDVIVDVADIPNLAYMPNPGEFGDNYAVIGFKVSDGNVFSEIANILTINVMQVSGLSDFSNEVQLIVYPNPAKDVLGIRGNFPFSIKELSITLTDVLGQVIHQKAWSNSVEQFEEQWQVEELPSGTYFVKVTSGEHQRVLKWFKE